VLALEYANHVLDGANVSRVAAALGLAQGICTGHPVNHIPERRREDGAINSGTLADTLPPLHAASTTFYVDSDKGSDAAAGTLTAPFKTIAKAQVEARAAKQTSGGRSVTVLLREGTFFLGLAGSLKFGPEDSGTTYAGYPGETAVLSGGVDFSGLSWSKSTSVPSAWEAVLPAAAASAAIQALFVGGSREIRAKYPNGDPVIPGGAGWSATASGPLGHFAASGVAFNATVQVFSEDGILLSNGAAPGGEWRNFTVDYPRVGFNPTRNDFHAYANNSAERFNTTFNHPFWNSQTSPGFSTKSLTKNWADPSTAIIHMYHTGGWGG